MNVLCKETLFWIPYVIDLLLCLIQFPLFAINGPIWMAKMICGDDKKEDDKYVVSPEFIQLYDTFVLCYSGYCLMMFYGCYTIVVYPELLPVFGGLMLAINLAKIVLILRWESRGGGNTKMQKGKHASLFYFNLPTYGGYVLLHFLQGQN